MSTMITRESVKIEKDVLDKTRKYCKNNGLKLTFFISRAIEKELNINCSPIVDGHHPKAQLTIDGD